MKVIDWVWKSSQHKFVGESYTVLAPYQDPKEYVLRALFPNRLILYFRF
jgi:hypothetical protein